MLHFSAAEKLEFLLTMLAERGEEETFRYIRKQVRRNRVGMTKWRGFDMAKVKEVGGQDT